jgi:hypothetical protein
MVLDSFTNQPIPFEFVKPIYDYLIKLANDDGEVTRTMKYILAGALGSYDREGGKENLVDYAQQFIKRSGR